MLFQTMLTFNEVYKTILGQMGSKMGFWGVFGRVSREETHFLGSRGSKLAISRSAEQHLLFSTSWSFGDVSGQP